MWDSKIKNAAILLAGFQPNLSTIRFNDLFTIGQTYTGTFIGVLMVQAMEDPENLSMVFRIDTHTIVLGAEFPIGFLFDSFNFNTRVDGWFMKFDSVTH